jgi:glycosyltransferase involved in cell wall biosynthesis
MKRIALFPSAFHPSLGGVEELTGQLALNFVKRGLEVMIFTNRWPRDLPCKEQWRGIALRRLPFRLPENGMKSWLGSCLTRRLVCRDLFEQVRAFRADVIHIQCLSSNGWYASAVAAQLGVPLVATAQGELTMDAGGLYQKSPLHNRLLEVAVGGAQRVTGCSKSTLGDLEAFFGRPFGMRGVVVHNGVGLEAFESGPRWVHTAPYFLGIGRIVPQKGFYELIKAYAASGVVDIDLLLAGEGPDMARLCALRAELGLCGRVHFLGRAGRTAVHSLMRGATGVVVPSLREPFGIVSLEAMAAGKALLASRVGGIPEVVPSGLGVHLVPPGDVDALAEGLRWLSAGATSDCAEGLRRHAMRFVWPRIAERYLAVYREARQVA